MKELEQQTFILKTNDRLILKNKKRLLERWVVAYQDVLRPKLVKKQMRFINPGTKQSWRNLDFINNNRLTLWGGEPAAAILTKNIIPENFSIYTTQSWQYLGQEIGLVPDVNGKVEILQVFWKTQNTDINQVTTPPLLIYADLIGSGYGRNIEVANIILENELQYIQ